MDEEREHQQLAVQQQHDIDDDDDFEDVDVSEERGLKVQEINVGTGSKLWNRKYVFIVLFVVFCLIVGIVAAILHSRSPQDGGDDKPWHNLRLGKKVFPRAYDLRLNVDMENDTYAGNVTIDVYISQPTHYIMFNKVQLTVSQVHIADMQGGDVEVVEQFYYPLNEVYVVRTAEGLAQGENFTLTVSFHNNLSSDLSGLYKSHYQEGNTKKKLACTFFSPISARKAFPCFDEPLFKARFTLTLTHSDQYHALSNMPIKSKHQHTNGLLTTRFESSIKMSTYIVAWLISEFESIPLTNTTTPVMKGWAQKDKLDDIRYSLQATKNLLRFYETYFDIPFPLTKLDTVALPNLAPGAMENWGMIFYRAPIVLYNNDTGTQLNKQEAFNIIAHELVHQWFGNLVTMEYWTDAWLKEGFANNIAIIGGDEVDSALELRKQVLTNLMLPAMDADAYSLSSHPISTKVETTSDVRQVFNVITYNKGSCIVEIIRQFLGADGFKNGLRKYLKLYSYRNAVQDDLWQALSNATGKDVKQVMDTWTLQLGYPVVSVRRINRTTLHISQQRFSLDVPDTQPPDSPFDYIWKIPIVVQNPLTKQRKKDLLETESFLMNIGSEYSIVNPEHSLFYRVNYDPQMLADINNQLITNPKQFSTDDRTGLISDQFNFVAAGLTNLESALDILKYLKDETEYYPWKEALNYLSRIHSLIEDNTLRTSFDMFIRNITAKIINNTGWHYPRTANEGSLQILMMTQACNNDPYLKVTSKIEEAKILFQSEMNGTKVNVRPSLVPVINDCAIAHGPDEYWEYTFRKYKEGGAMKDSLMISLTATTDNKTLTRLLNYALDGSGIFETQDLPYIVDKIATRSVVGKRMCWNFIKKNWEYIIKTYGNELYLLGYMLQNVLEKFSTQKDLNDIEKFFRDKDLRSGSQAYKKGVTKIQANIEWKKRHSSDLKKWLKKQMN